MSPDSDALRSSLTLKRTKMATTPNARNMVRNSGLELAGTCCISDCPEFSRSSRHRSRSANLYCKYVWTVEYYIFLFIAPIGF